MARRPPAIPPPAEPEHPVLVCAIQSTNAFKLSGDGSGSLTVHFDSSQADTITEIYKHYRETELHLPFIKVAS